MALTIVIFNDGPLMTLIIDAYMEMVKDRHHIQWTIVMYGDGISNNLTIDIIFIIISMVMVPTRSSPTINLKNF